MRHSDALKVSKDLATRGADSVDGLRSSVTTWFNFYNGYDPLFTWWMGMPYKQVDAALQDYAAFLRDKVAPADAIAAPGAASRGHDSAGAGDEAQRGSRSAGDHRAAAGRDARRRAALCRARPAAAAGAARPTALAAGVRASTTSTGSRR